MASVLSRIGRMLYGEKFSVYGMSKRLGYRLCWFVLMMVVVNAGEIDRAYSDNLRLAITTSLEDSGLLKKLWQAYGGVQVQIIAVGSGAALELGRRGDVDLLVVHDKESEEQFIGEGYGLARLPWVRNDFVLLGSKTDSAGVANVAKADGILKALQLLSLRGEKFGDVTFVSRGDNSGTHERELALQKLAGIDLKKALGSRYVVSGQGMGASLNIAVNKQGYILSDLGSWLNRSQSSQDMQVLVDGSLHLENPYSVLILSSSVAKKQMVLDLVSWLFSKDAREIIKAYKRQGVRIFTPQAVWPTAMEIEQLLGD